MSSSGAVSLVLPFRETWLTRNSPARRVPSHGTSPFATTYAVDFVAVQGRRTATTRSWRTVLAGELAERGVRGGSEVVEPL